MKTNRVVAQAMMDYEPSIVNINESHIAQLQLDVQDFDKLSDNELKVLQSKTLEQAVYFLLGLNSINYQYWDVEHGVFRRYVHHNKVGALAAFDGFFGLFKEFLQSKVDHQSLTEADLFTNFGDIPDLHGRLEILRESLDLAKLQQAFAIIDSDVKERKLLDTETAHKISILMPVSFSDPYLKKIQLALFKIYAVYLMHGYDVACDVTVAADYQLSKVLEHKGILEYSEALITMIEDMQLLESDSIEEKAIRAATILACEKISEALHIDIPTLDNVLWQSRNSVPNKKFHLTKTTRY